MKRPLANQNVPSELRMKLTGHKTEGEHRKYTHHEMDNLRDAIKKNPIPWLNLIFPRRASRNSVYLNNI